MIPNSFDLNRSYDATRRTAQRKGLEGYDELRIVIESFRTGAIILDDHGRVAFANSQTTEMFGCQQKQLLGRPVETLIPQYFADPSGRPTSSAADLSGLRNDGSEFKVGVTKYPIRVNGTLLILRPITDITERKLSEQAFIDVSLQLLEANEQIRNMKCELEFENTDLKQQIRREGNHLEIIGQSQPILQTLMKVDQVAPTDATVLLLGETGTGKELIARAIHNSSKRKVQRMVIVNCAALPASLVENELFGRERGAYTGALTREIGRFELADRSTIFLDEIGELPLELQGKLLRILQEGDFERLGCSKTIHVDVRVIAATSRNLEAAVKEGKFREDLFYRLNVFPIRIPPLRERREDVPMLTWHFLRELGGKMGRDVESVQAATMKMFQGYAWPGNVRELRNVIERNLILHAGPVFEAGFEGVATPVIVGTTIEEVERNHIGATLARSSWRIRGLGGAAETLGLKPTTLEARMKKLGIFRQ